MPTKSGPGKPVISRVQTPHKGGKKTSSPFIRGHLLGPHASNYKDRLGAHFARINGTCPFQMRFVQGSYDHVKITTEASFVELFIEKGHPNTGEKETAIQKKNASCIVLLPIPGSVFGLLIKIDMGVSENRGTTNHPF